MRALLDTHTLLWFLAGERELSARSRALIEDPENQILVSVASLWEIAIKMSVGKLNVGGSFAGFVEEHLNQSAFELLEIVTPHLITLSELPLHHRDPFDRLLIAQAAAEDLPIIGVDRVFDSYPVQRIW